MDWLRFNNLSPLSVCVPLHATELACHICAMRKALNQTIMILTPAFEVHSGRFDCFAHFDFNYGIDLKICALSISCV